MDQVTCPHPTNRVFYESNELEEESHWCADCNLWLTDFEVIEIRNRPDWVTWQTE